MRSTARTPPRRRGVARWLCAAASAALAGCTTFSADSGFGPVEQTAQARIGTAPLWPRSDADRDEVAQRVAALLAKPLSADDAVQIALINNRGLRATFHELGIAEADLVQAGRLPNPGFAFARKTQGSGLEIERLFAINLARVLVIPLATEMERRRFAQTQRLVTQEVLALAADTRRAYYMALAADESTRYLRQVMTAAEAAADLGRRMAQVGNWSALQQAREQGFYADAALNLARGAQAQTAARERLTRLLGLWGDQAAAFRLAERLPDLPPQPDDLPDVEQRAMAQRLDVQAARLATEELAANLGLTRATRFVNVFEVGVIRNSFNDAGPQRGYEVGFELPLFDWGDARVAKAEALYLQAVERTAETAINARSEVREAYLTYRSAYDIARHWREQIVPTRKRIADENLLRYNGMLIGVFELLADARAQIGSVNGAIEALRDFWIARAELDRALIGKPGASTAPVNAAMAAPAAAGH